MYVLQHKRSGKYVYDTDWNRKKTRQILVKDINFAAICRASYLTGIEETRREINKKYYIWVEVEIKPILQ